MIVDSADGFEALPLFDADDDVLTVEFKINLLGTCRRRKINCPRVSCLTWTHNNGDDR